jgi:molecular chaperone GrpE
MFPIDPGKKAMSETNEHPDDELTPDTESGEPNGGEEAAPEEETPTIPLDPLARAIAERDASHDQLLRAQAEQENFRKRMQKERADERLYQDAGFARAVLPPLDNLERALAAAADSEPKSELVEGVRMVAKQFNDVLSSFSVKAIDAVGQPFDPNFHEAIQQLPSDEHPKMTVIQEIERGYQLHERIIRPSKVIVSSGPAEATE